MTYTQELREFKRWLRRQRMNPLAELYADYLYFSVGGWEAIREWQSAQHAVAPDAATAPQKSKSRRPRG